MNESPANQTVTLPINFVKMAFDWVVFILLSGSAGAGSAYYFGGSDRDSIHHMEAQIAVLKSQIDSMNKEHDRMQEKLQYLERKR